MDKLTFKNYPPIILAFLLCLIVALNFGFKVLYGTIWEHKTISFFDEVLIIVLSYSTAIGALSIINKHFVWKWFFKILGIAYIKGDYFGHIVSSHYVNDDPKAGHVNVYCQIKIIQNINAFKIEGNFYTDELCTDQTSSFTTSWEEMKKKEDGDYFIRYFYSNKGNKLHAKYVLNNHDGVCILTFSPKNHKMEGEYFTHERSSFGRIYLKLEK